MTDEQRVTVPDEDVELFRKTVMLRYGVPTYAMRKALEALYPIWRRRELVFRELVAEQQLATLQADYNRLLYRVGDGSRQRDWQTMRELGQQVEELRRELFHAGHSEFCSRGGQPARSCYICGVEKLEAQLEEARSLIAEMNKAGEGYLPEIDRLADLVEQQGDELHVVRAQLDAARKLMDERNLYVVGGTFVEKMAEALGVEK